MKTQRAGRGDRRRSFWKSRQSVGRERPWPQLRRLRLELLEDRRLLDGAASLADPFDVSALLLAQGPDPRADELVGYVLADPEAAAGHYDTVRHLGAGSIETAEVEAIERSGAEMPAGDPSLAAQSESKDGDPVVSRRAALDRDAYLITTDAGVAEGINAWGPLNMEYFAGCPGNEWVIYDVGQEVYEASSFATSLPSSPPRGEIVGVLGCLIGKSSFWAKIAMKWCVPMISSLRRRIQPVSSACWGNRPGDRHLFPPLTFYAAAG